MEPSEQSYPTRLIYNESLSADNREHTLLHPPLPPRSLFEGIARAPPTFVPSAPAPPAVTRPTDSRLYVAPDGTHVRSSAGFRAGTVPGNYRSPFDHNMVHHGFGRGMPSSSQPIYGPTIPYGSGHGTPSSNQQIYGPGLPYAPGLPAAAPQTQAVDVPAPVAAPQTKAIIPPQGVSKSPPHANHPTNPSQTPHRLILLGPLKMIRSQCAKKTILRPILIWIDQHMGEELRTSVYADTLVSNITYAVTIPMTDDNWRDWNKVLAVFPRAAAWQAALTLEEPFDQVTQQHPSMPLFVEGEELESLLVDLVQTYNLGVQRDIYRQ